MDELKDVTDWQNLGLQLKIRQSVLEEVEINNHDVNKRKRSMLIRWLKSNTKAAWDDIVSALRNMEEMRVAETIEEKYCKTSS